MNATEGFKDHLDAAQKTEALIRDMLAKGRSLQVIVATSAWSLFEVRQIATAEGYDFTKDGAPFKPAPKLTRGRHPAEAAAHPIDDERTAPPAFVPSPTPDPPNCHVQVMPALHPEPEHPATTTTAAPRAAADTDEAAAMTSPHRPTPHTMDTDELIRLGLTASAPKIRRAAERATDSLRHLEQLITDALALAEAKADKERAFAQARAAVAALEQQLAEARKQLRTRDTASTPNPGHLTADRLAERDRNQAMRVWGRANGYDVPNVGRVRAEVVQAYREAHPDEGAQP